MGRMRKRDARSYQHSKPVQTQPKAQKTPHKTTHRDDHRSNDQRPTIPFQAEDHILLVGEGDFSFARSIVDHHACMAVTATCFDTEREITDKYPQAKSHIDYLLEEDQKVLYGVDATKLASKKELRKVNNFDRILFNFPHVGGLTKDVNRQVRFNQELLVGFFKSAIPLLRPEGTIVVTLFEGDPYTLWNIRDLARHSGLKVGRSFKFDSAVYPEYRHARTLGNIEGGGGWKGETRSARSYIFEMSSPQTAQHTASSRHQSRQKRKREETSSEED